MTRVHTPVERQCRQRDSDVREEPERLLQEEPEGWLPALLRLPALAVH
jgi:hypothetical protein